MGRAAHRDHGPSDAIADWLRGHGEEMAGLIAELVTIPTENPPGNNYVKCADVLQARLRDAGLVWERFNEQADQEERSEPPARPTQAGAPCLMASYGRGERVLYFHGHYDVVPAQSPQQFVPRRERDFLFGRGSCDMKGGLVSMLYAVRALEECGVALDGRVALMMVPDEETGGRRGSAGLAKNGLLGHAGIGMLTAEPTSGVVWHANRGAITLRIEVLGKPAHVGLQYQGENAFERMHMVVSKLLELKREVEKRATRLQPGERIKQTRGDLTPRGARNSILLLGGESGGGTNFNVVPERCWFTVDRRINPEEDLEAEKARLIGVLEECKRNGVPLRWEILQEGRSASSAEDGLLGRSLANTIRSVLGETPQFQLCPGLLETRFYAARGIPAFAYGPGLLSVAHGPNEYVDLRRVVDCAAVYALTAAEILKA